MGKNIILAMSGGIDSSMAAYILKSKGYSLTGVTMKLWGANLEESYACGSAKDIEDAKKIAEKLGFKHIVLELDGCFKEKIINYFIDEYRSGRTPNPCAVCNREIKFAIPELLGMEGAYFATGHYARIEKNGSGRYGLYRAYDSKKDQSYFLSFLTQKQLSRTIFPLSGIKKSELKQLSEELGFHLHEKKESQDFKAAKQLKSSIPAKIGEICDRDGRKLGEHHGIHMYTIGQRRGLGISSNGILYVTELDPKTNRVIVGSEKELLTYGLTLDRLNFLGRVLNCGESLDGEIKIRAGSTPVPANLKVELDGTGTVRFKTALKGVTKGQVGAFYVGEELAISGFITDTL